jgi:periplasmic protein TonB
MKNLILFVLFLPFSLFAQEKTSTETITIEVEPIEEAPADEDVYTIVDTLPEYPGGPEAMFKYMSSEIVYPEVMKKAGIMGTVYIGFIVEKNGSISNAKVLKGIGGGCDEEALRVVNAMPDWSPGIQRGKAVRVHFTLPIKYFLATAPEDSEDED